MNLEKIWIIGSSINFGRSCQYWSHRETLKYIRQLPTFTVPNFLISKFIMVLWSQTCHPKTALRIIEPLICIILLSGSVSFLLLELPCPMSNVQCIKINVVSEFLLTHPKGHFWARKDGYFCQKCPQKSKMARNGKINRNPTVWPSGSSHGEHGDQNDSRLWSAWVTQPERQRHEGQSKLEVSCYIQGVFFSIMGLPLKVLSTDKLI